MGSQQEKGQLERTLGFGEAFTIGVGTMIGAGIFIFPGIAAGQAGLAASVSFGLGAIVAMMVALSVAELATAIPKSGGTYYFVAEGMGRVLGAVVGLGLWWGLIFASAFYLVGFGLYIDKIAAELGLGWSVSSQTIGVTSALLLTLVNILGTEKSGDLQNIIVGSLLTILAIFVGYGLLDAFGVFGRTTVPEEFAPFGVLPIFSTASLVFTSYLGFAGIANVAGEIKEPHKNLPRALIGSVALVGTLYIVTILISTSAFGSARLAELGETALVEVGRTYLGRIGAVTILFGGLLATVSSANASLLGSSRSVYALSDDGILPGWVSEVNESFGTPHLAIISAGIPIAAIILLGRVEVLAEVASFLHLVLYGLMCLSAWKLRRDEPDWYNPSFTAPGHPVVPLAGGAASFGLILFMKPASQFIGAGVLLAGWVWYELNRRWRSEPSEGDNDE
jgi:amino acid transporter